MNLSPHVTSPEVLANMRVFGDVVAVTMGPKMGYASSATVEFNEVDEAIAAVDELDGLFIRRKKLFVDFGVKSLQLH